MSNQTVIKHDYVLYVERNGKESMIKVRADALVPNLVAGESIFLCGASYTLIKYDYELVYIEVDESNASRN